MWTRAQPGQPGNPLRQFGMFFVVFACVLIIATLVGVFRTHPELRTPAAWLPYDLTAEARVSGVIEAVQEFQCPWSGTEAGVHLLLKTDGRTVYVHAGDAKFLRAHHAIFHPGEKIDVVGQKLSIGGEEALIARELNCGGTRLAVRDAEGKPLWVPE